MGILLGFNLEVFDIGNIDHLKTGGSYSNTGSFGEVLSLGIVPLVLMRVRATP